MMRLAQLAEAVGVIVGVPSYRRYLEHVTVHHPDRVPMSETEFFRARQKARYEGGAGKCC